MTKQKPRDDSNQGEEENVEHVFSCIEQGNAARDRGADWDAASFYLDAYALLRRLCATPDGPLRTLYHQQSIDYYATARGCLRRALQKEQEMGETTNVASWKEANATVTDTAMPVAPHEALLSTEERTKRAQLFQRFYHIPRKETAAEVAAPQDASNEVAADPLPALEWRLQQLRQSLPSHLQTERERDQQRQRQLQRLGICTKRTPTTPSLVASTIERPSASEQVQEIIAQVREELSLKQPIPQATDHSPADAEEEEVVLQGEEEEDAVQALLATLALNAKGTQAPPQGANDLQTEVAALLEQARQEGLLKEQEEEDELTPSSSDEASLEDELSRDD